MDLIMISTHLPDRAQKINNLSKYACVKKVDPFKIIIKLSSWCSWKMAATILMAPEITLYLNHTINIVLTKFNPFLMCLLVHQLLMEMINLGVSILSTVKATEFTFLVNPNTRISI